MAVNKSKRRKAERLKAERLKAERLKAERHEAEQHKPANPDAGHPVKSGIFALDRLTWPPPAVVAALLLLTGAVLRLLYLGEIPGGLNQDEASSGYEAWALLHHGIDRNGYAWPVHFVSWGNGQNALYAYLSMPIIAALDLTMFSTRLLMALTGIASLLLFWRVAARDQPAPRSPREVPGATFALLALLLLTLCPWHFMLSRWALESNFLPFVILLSVYFFTRPDNHRPGIQAAGVLVLSLSVYAYGTAYFFAPLFLALVFGWLRVQGKLPLWRFLLLSALSLLTVLPLLLFLAVNFFDWEAIRAGISMPKYTGKARYEQISLLFGGRFLSYFADQLLFVVKILSMSDPGVFTEFFNKMPRFAILFPFAIVPLAFGFGATIHRAVKLREFGVPALMALWLVAALALVSVTLANINRVNVLWLPAIYFTALGVFYACRRWRALLPVAAAAYLIYGGWFAHTYFTQYNDLRHNYPWPSYNLHSAFTSLSERAGPNDKIYITPSVHEAYMLTLFHTKTPPQDYLATRTFISLNQSFQKVASFGNFIFIPERIDEADHLVLLKSDRSIVANNEKEQALVQEALSSDRCDTEVHGDFVVLHCD